MHAAAIHAHHRLRQEAGCQAHMRSHLSANQLVNLDLIRRCDNLPVAVVDFELRWRDFRMVFFVLEAHGTLHFRGSIDERAQQVAGQRVIVAAGVDVFEFASFVIAPLRVRPFE